MKIPISSFSFLFLAVTLSISLVFFNVNAETMQTPLAPQDENKNKVDGVRLIPMKNPKQPFEIAAKIQWNPHNKCWDKVMVLYNGNSQPPAEHPVWAYLKDIKQPQRSAKTAGENLHYKAFHSYNYCTGMTPLSRGKDWLINFDKNALGSYSNKDFSNDWNCPTWQMGKDKASIVGGNKAHQGKALQLHFPPKLSGCTKNSCINWKPRLGGQFTSLYYSFWVKFPEDFDFALGGKLPGIGSNKANTNGKKPNGHDGWSVRMMWNRHGQLGQYVYHMDQPSTFGEFMQWDTSAISKGQWHHIETAVRLNTPQQKNGVIQTWLDGKPVFNKNNLRFRLNTGLEIEQLLFSTFFGGSGEAWAPKKQETIFIDDFLLSQQIPH